MSSDLAEAQRRTGDAVHAVAVAAVAEGAPAPVAAASGTRNLGFFA